jgi:glycosyltransferase involved in cell wall biosynthesis
MTFINLDEKLFRSREIPSDADIVFVADAFAEDYAGGAELTFEALISSSPLKVHKVKSNDVTIELLNKGFKKFWIFGNFANLNAQLIPTICANISYAIIECDFKFCKYRSIEKHNEIEKKKCTCENDDTGKMVSAFLYGARSLWWMSEKQLDLYCDRFPFLKDKNNTVLSSVFDDKTFAKIKLLKAKYNNKKTNKWIVTGSPSWIKGTNDAVEWCKNNNKEHDVIWNVSYDQMLEAFAQAEGFVFLPKGGDTCPRQVIEAKMLGCKLHMNDNVMHKDEIWFNTNDEFDTEAYLYMARSRFWNGIKADMAYRPTISGYTTTKDCIKQCYPFEQSIKSMLGFCDQVVVVDGGSTDGTWERLKELKEADNRVVIHQQARDWSAKRFAVFDGQQKALARALCTSEWCWQQDSDEIVHENDYDKIKNIIKFLPKNVPLLALPVIEYWGSYEKVRMDITVWKWRLSQNLPHITHGIPAALRKFDKDGELYSALGSDGCDYINVSDYNPIQFANFYTADVEQVRQAALANNEQARQQFEMWFNAVINEAPAVHHYSWFDITRKIKTYKEYWSKHWQSLYDIEQADIPENNNFFSKVWSDVTEDDIITLAERLKNEMGGWIFHRRVNFDTPTPYIKCSRQPPEVMNDFKVK